MLFAAPGMPALAATNRLRSWAETQKLESFSKEPEDGLAEG
jgi:hypothetical protein